MNFSARTLQLPERHRSDTMVRLKVEHVWWPKLNMPRDLRGSWCARMNGASVTRRMLGNESYPVPFATTIEHGRLNMVRSALRRADPANASVTEIDRTYQFQEPGGFAVTCRSVFGKMPSTTLRRASTQFA
jgi:hypothetical protein